MTHLPIRNIPHLSYAVVKGAIATNPLGHGQVD